MKVTRRGISTVQIVVIALLIAGGVVAAYVVYESRVPTPATITPYVGAIAEGGSTQVSISWTGGAVPYTVTLYSSTSSSCTTASNEIDLKSNLPSPGATFSVAPTSDTYYCGTVQSQKGSSAVSKAGEIYVNPSQQTPTVTLSPSMIDSGQTVPLSVLVKWSGGTSPYTVTLYSGSNSTCSLDKTQVQVTAGTNPQTGVSGSSATFATTDPVSTRYYCATVTDSSTTPLTSTSQAQAFVVNFPLSASISPSSPNVDSGSSINLTAATQLGSPPYKFQWYTGSLCESSAEISGETGAVMDTGPVSSAVTYSVMVTDSSPGTPSASVCAHDSITVSPALAGTAVSISPSTFVIDSGQMIRLVVSWTSAGVPPYNVQLETSASPSCSSPVPLGLPAQGVTHLTTSFVVSPSSTSYVCASVQDSAAVAQTANTTVGSLVTVNPKLVPKEQLSPNAIDMGQSGSVTVTVTWTGGTSPYSVSIFSGGSTTCSEDTTSVGVLTGSNPVTGLGTGPARFSIASQPLSTYYCAIVSDGATIAGSANVTQEFTVNSPLSASISPAAPVLDAGSKLLLTALPLHGTFPYATQWYTGATCASGNEIAGEDSAGMETPLLNSTTTYSALITDGSPAAPLAGACASVTITVNPALASGISLSVSALDSGQTTTIVATVTWTGGTAPYSATLFSGTSATCTSDTTKVAVLTGTGSNPETQLALTTARFSFSSPTSSLYYCALVSDAASVSSSLRTSTTLLTVSPALGTPVLGLSKSVINTGQSAALTATVAWSGGTAPYTVTLYSGTSASCSADTTVVALTSGTNPRTGLMSPTVVLDYVSPSLTTYYCISVTDSSFSPVTVPSTSSEFTVNPALAVTVSPGGPSVDSGESVTVLLTATVTGGTPAYHYQWYTGAGCSASIAGQSSSSFSTGVLASTTTYSVKVTDSSEGTPSASSCASDTVTVNPVLTDSLTLTPSVIDSGEATSFSAIVTWSSGTSPYTVTLTSGYSSTCTADTTAVSSKTNVVGSTTTFTVTVSGGEYYCATVTDAAYVPVSVRTAAELFTVNPTLTAPSVAATPATIDGGQSSGLLANPFSGGTAPYTCQWLVATPSAPSTFNPLGSPFSAGCTPSSAPAISTGTLSTVGVWHFELKVTDSASVPVTATSAAFAVTVLSPLGATVSPPAPVIDNGSSTLLTAAPSNGLSPYTYQWYYGLVCSGLNEIPLATTPSLQTGVLTVTATYSVMINDSSTAQPSAGVCTGVTVTVVQGPQGIAVDSSTDMIYVVNWGSNTLTVINGATSTVVATLSVGTNPWGVAVDSATNMVYVTNYGSDNVYIVNGINGTTTTPSVAAIVSVGHGPKGVAVDTTTNIAYVTNSLDNSVTSISRAKVAISTVSVGTGPTGLAVNPTTDLIYVADYGQGSLTVINGVTQATATIPVGTDPWGVAVNPTTNMVYVTNSGSGTVSVVNGTTFLLSTSITVGTTPQGITIDTATNRIYVDNSGGDTVTVINSNTNAVVTSINVGNTPWGVDVDTATNTIYVTNPVSSAVTVIRGSTETVNGAIII